VPRAPRRRGTRDEEERLGASKTHLSREEAPPFSYGGHWNDTGCRTAIQLATRLVGGTQGIVEDGVRFATVRGMTDAFS
jgi:hypothetical protein